MACEDRGSARGTNEHVTAAGHQRWALGNMWSVPLEVPSPVRGLAIYPPTLGVTGGRLKGKSPGWSQLLAAKSS